MARDHSARDAFLKAGELLLYRPEGLSELNPKSISAAAKLPQDVFEDTFDSIESFKHELLGYLMDVVRASVLDPAMATPRAGMERIWHSMEAFLDANLRHPAMRSLAYALRTDPTALDLMRRRTAGYSLVFKVELEALGKTDAAAAARLLTSMTVETARAEHDAQHALADMRRALYAMLKGYLG